VVAIAVDRGIVVNWHSATGTPNPREHVATRRAHDVFISGAH